MRTLIEIDGRLYRPNGFMGALTFVNYVYNLHLYVNYKVINLVR